METRKVFVATILGAFLGVACARDYCNYNCPNVNHIGCNNKGLWSASCPSQKTLVSLSPAEKQAIVDNHNNYRNIIAGGNARKLPAACRMATMQWNEELAYLASLNVRACAMKHDKCHNTAEFKISGQNLAWIKDNYNGNVKQYVLKCIRFWYDEIAHLNKAHIMAYPVHTEPVIGHVTIMATDRNTHVGCAVSIYSRSNQRQKAFLMACNYATTNIYGLKLYSICTKPASHCTTGVNPNYKFLCSTNEVINSNVLYY